MDAQSQMQIFFMISSVGFVIVFIFVVVLLFYSIRAARTFEKIVEKLDGNLDKIGDTAQEMLEDMRNSVIFKFLFRHKKRLKKD